MRFNTFFSRKLILADLHILLNKIVGLIQNQLTQKKHCRLPLLILINQLGERVM